MIIVQLITILMKLNVAPIKYISIQKQEYNNYNNRKVKSLAPVANPSKLEIILNTKELDNAYACYIML